VNQQTSVRVGVDGTPLLGRRTGVGRYVDGLLTALTRCPSRPDLRLTAFTARGAGHLPRYPGIPITHRPVPARLLQRLWTHSEVPPVEWLAGRCDVFHATNFVLPPTGRAAGVVMVHDLTYALHADTVTPAVRRYRTLVPRSVRRASIVVCPARSTANDVAHHFGLDPARVMVTPHGVDRSWLETPRPGHSQKARLGLPPRYVVAVGTREPRKNLHVVLAAHARARQSDSEVVPPLVIVGAAGWGPDVNTHDDVILTGYVDDPTLRTTVAGADCLVLASRYEGFGLPLLEALGCGTPVVASDLPVHREVCGPHARLAPVGDVEALAEVLTATLAEARDEAADSVRRAWAAQWTWERCARATLAAYERAVSS
jgi:glycosyltransferase involved in cell wall biosynthesis